MYEDNGKIERASITKGASGPDVISKLPSG
jgi:hypothetical protein